MQFSDDVQALVATARSTDPDVRFEPVDRTDLASVIAKLPVSEDLLRWYETDAPLDVELFVFSDYVGTELYDPRTLLEKQIGYRWGTEGGQTYEGWSENWIAIGDWGGDPIIARVDLPGTPVAISMHGQGSWELKPLAQSLSAYLAALAICLEFIAAYGGNQAIRLEDHEIEDLPIRKDVVEEARRRLSHVLDNECLPYWPWL